MERELAHVGRPLAIHAQDDVADLQVRVGRRPVRIDVRDHHAPGFRQLESGGHGRVHGLHRHPHHHPAHASIGAQLAGDVAHGVTRNGEADTFAASRLAEDHGVDAYHAPLGVDQRTAGVAGIDGRIRLNIGRHVVRVELAGHRAHHSHRHRIAEPERRAQGEDQLPLLELARIAELEEGAARGPES